MPAWKEDDCVAPQKLLEIAATTEPMRLHEWKTGEASAEAPVVVPPQSGAVRAALLLGLFTRLAAIGMFLVNGLPKPYHPVFNVESFERASQDRYFLVIESQDEMFDRRATEELLRRFDPEEVAEVEH